MITIKRLSLPLCALCALAACGSDEESSAAPSGVEASAGSPASADADKQPDKAADNDGEKAAQTGSSSSKNDAADTYRDYPDPRGACAINSGYPDDRACILPPSPEEGMQIHVGPSNYDDPEEVAKFIMRPGEESSECWTFHTPNDTDIYYQTAVLSGRAGTHHIINTMFDGDLKDGGFTRCADGGTGQSVTSIGSLPGASKPYMPRGHIAPENKYVGRKIPARVAAQADMHYYNFTERDIIREFWMNIYFVDASQVKEEASQIRGMGGFGWNREPIAPGTDKVYEYSCPIKGEGRILSLLGHYHAHGKRFTARLKRGDADPIKVFEMFDFMDPASFEYDSRTKNPDFSDSAAGALSGVLEVHDGDVLSWECHIVNDSNVGLRYVNEVKTGEMCNLWGASLGIEPFNCLKQ